MDSAVDAAFPIDTAHLVAFVWFGGPATAELAILAYWVQVMKIAVYGVQTCIGDAILIYRCYIVYGRRWRAIVVSVILWIATVVCSTMWPIYEDRVRIGNSNNASLVPIITSYIVITLVNNVLTTSLIIYRIWTIHAATRRYVDDPPTRCARVVRTMTESALAYTLASGVLVVCYLCGNNAMFGVSDSIVQIIGITFNLIIGGVGRGTATDPGAARAAPLLAAARARPTESATLGADETREWAADEADDAKDMKGAGDAGPMPAWRTVSSASGASGRASAESAA